MKIKIIFILAFTLLSISNCNNSSEEEVPAISSFWNDCSVVAHKEGVRNISDTIVAFDFNLLSQTKDIPLALLVDSMSVVCLTIPNAKSLISSRLSKVRFSENFICVSTYNQSPLMLFDMKGNFIRNIGGIGDKPGEYQAIDNIFMDEKYTRIYIMPVNMNYISEYDFSGRFYRNIRLFQPNTSGSSFRVNWEKGEILMIKPIDKTSSHCVWKQDFNGKFKHGVASFTYYKGEGDCSTASITRFNTQSTEIFQERKNNGIDYLFHFIPDGNRFSPKFRMMNADKSISYRVYEFPTNYMIETTPAQLTEDASLAKKIIIDKKTLRGCYFSGFTTDYGMLLGSGQSFLLDKMYDGYFSVMETTSEVEQSISKIDIKKLNESQKEHLSKLQELIAVSKKNTADCLLLFKGK